MQAVGEMIMHLHTTEMPSLKHTLGQGRALMLRRRIQLSTTLFGPSHPPLPKRNERATNLETATFQTSTSALADGNRVSVSRAEIEPAELSRQLSGL